MASMIYHVKTATLQILLIVDEKIATVKTV